MDYKRLLKKYMYLIGLEEGSSYIGGVCHKPDMIALGMTDQDCSEIIRIAEEVMKGGNPE